MADVIPFTKSTASENCPAVEARVSQTLEASLRELSFGLSEVLRSGLDLDLAAELSDVIVRLEKAIDQVDALVSAFTHAQTRSGLLSKLKRANQVLSSARGQIARSSDLVDR